MHSFELRYCTLKWSISNIPLQVVDTSEGNLRDWAARSVEESKKHSDAAAKIPKSIVFLLNKRWCINIEIIFNNLDKYRTSSIYFITLPFRFD